MGIKYCFRYNARNRAIARGEAIDPISMEPVHPRPHRRRREKKLMTLDEVNERFPHVKYEDWAAARAHEGLPTAGGVTAPAGSRPATLRDADGVLPTSPTSTKHFDAAADVGEVPTSPTTTSPPAPHPSTDTTEKPNTTPAHLPALTSTATNTTHYDPKHTGDDSDDEDLHILPPALLDHPGDSCAICIDVIEPTDDVRGLTCGHAFHACCLDPWLTSRRACCPLCKADYYIPKPRAEGDDHEARERDRERRRRERAEGRGVNLPQQPGNAWVGGRFFLPMRSGDAGGRGWQGRPPRGDGAGAGALAGMGRQGGVGRFFTWRRSAGASGTTPAQLEAQIRR